MEKNIISIIYALCPYRLLQMSPFLILFLLQLLN